MASGSGALLVRPGSFSLGRTVKKQVVGISLMVTKVMGVITPTYAGTKAKRKRQLLLEIPGRQRRT